MTKARDIASAAPAPSTVSATEIGYLDGVSSAIQTQIDGKSGTAHNHNSDYIAKTLTTTTGDIIYASSANNPARLGIGSTGNVLTVSGGVPTWAAPAGGGKVLQVVTATYSTAAQNSSTTYADTGLSVSITPSSVSSKVLVMAVQPVAATRNTAYAGVKARLVRTSTELAFANIIGEAQGSTLFAIHGSYSPIWLDSPATTSSVTYKTQFALVYTTSGGWLADAQPNNAQASIVALEIGA
jgi:hypothetical protein